MHKILTSAITITMKETRSKGPSKRLAKLQGSHGFRESDQRAAAVKSNTYLTLAHSKAAVQLNDGVRTIAAGA